MGVKFHVQSCNEYISFPAYYEKHLRYNGISHKLTLAHWIFCLAFWHLYMSTQNSARVAEGTSSACPELFDENKGFKGRREYTASTWVGWS